MLIQPKSAHSLRRWILSVGPGVLLSLLLTTAQAQTFVPTATKALTLKGATLISQNVEPSTPMHIVVALKLQNQSALKTFLQRISTPKDPLYGAALTPDRFAAAYAPTAAQVEAVENYLASYGFKNLQVEDNRLFISADGSAGDVESAFNTALAQYSQNQKTVFANTLDAEVPSSLSGTVLSVLGLNNIPAMRSMLAMPGPAPKPSVTLPNPNMTVYGPHDYQKAYDAGATATGSLTGIAIFAEGNLTQVVKDLRLFETLYKLPQVPLTVVPTGIASTDTSGADEFDLDTQSSTGIAQQVKHLYIYDAPSLTDADLVIEFNRFVTQNLAKAGSASFGECEAFPYVDGSMLADDEIFSEAAAQGQTVFASTGDVGAACPVEGTNGVPDSGLPDQSYPASSPYVVAAGGTSLFTDSSGNYNMEAAWYAGGGGIAVLENTPFWQTGIVPAATAGKGVPDVAMCADPNICGANIYVSGATEVVGGTSLSSPLSLGVWARIESAHKNQLGFAAPLFYSLATAGTPFSTTVGFHDIVIGNNGGYSATPGWDYTTGLGSFDITEVSKLLK